MAMLASLLSYTMIAATIQARCTLREVFDVVVTFETRVMEALVDGAPVDACLS